MDVFNGQIWSKTSQYVIDISFLPIPDIDLGELGDSSGDGVVGEDSGICTKPDFENPGDVMKEIEFEFTNQQTIKKDLPEVNACVDDIFIINTLPDYLTFNNK